MKICKLNSCQSEFSPTYPRQYYCSSVCSLVAKKQHNVEYMQRQAIKNPELKRERNLAYKATHREKINKEQRERAVAYREKHREHLNAQALIRLKNRPDLTLRAAHRRRAAKLNAPICDFTPEQWIEVQNAFQHCCAYCEQPFTKLEIEHITPLSKGGSHTLHNIVPACRSCNAKKHRNAVPCPIQPLLLTIARPKNQLFQAIKQPLTV